MNQRSNFKNFGVAVLLYGVMPFLSFHAFAFALYYYLPSAPEIPILLYLPFCWLCSLRAMSYFPEFSTLLFRNRKGIRLPFSSHDARSTLGAVEAVFWYLILAYIYWHLHRSFGFPNTGNKMGGFALLGSYLAFFVGSLVGMGILVIVTRGLRDMLSELRKLVPVTRRLLSSSLAYLVTVFVFAGIHRTVSFHDPSSYQKPISSTVDAVYFSTVTMTTLGFGDITPQNSFAKLLTSVQALVGMFMFAILIGLAISLPADRKNEEA